MEPRPIGSRVLSPPGRAALLLASLLGWALGLGGSPPPAQAANSASLTVTIGVRDLYPPAPVTDLAALPGSEGQLMLQWTAPDSDGDIFSNRSAVAGYSLKIATFSADSVGSTTTWWNAAQTVAAPSPGSPGGIDSTLMSSLEPGNTYFAAVISSDTKGFVSPIDTKTAAPGQQAHGLVYDAIPTAVTGLAVTGLSTNTISLSWTASAIPDLWYYRVYVDSTSPYDFGNKYGITVASTSTSYIHAGLRSGTSYYYHVTAVDKGAPTYAGIALESLASSSASAVTAGTFVGLPPMSPFGIGLASPNSTTITLSWLPVRAYQDGQFFVSPSSPTLAELTGYHVYRATAPIAAPWTDMVTLSTATLSYVDAASGPQFYYHVKAYNPVGFSDASMIRAQSAQAYLVGYDGMTTFQMPDSVATPSLNGQVVDDSYLVKTSSHPEQIGDGVIKSIEFMPLRGGQTLEYGKQLNGAGILNFHFDTVSGLVVPNGLGAEAIDTAALTATPDNLSVFWFNGNKWLQLYGKIDAANQNVMVETPYLGTYQLRSAQRVGGFNFNSAGISNRMLTPNGDGKNDTTVFLFDNPKASEVRGRIFDDRARSVAEMIAGPLINSLQWDGKSNGRVVPAGVYIYQIESEGKKFSGTVVVIR